MVTHVTKSFFLHRESKYFRGSGGLILNTMVTTLKNDTVVFSEYIHGKYLRFSIEAPHISYIIFSNSVSSDENNTFNFTCDEFSFL